MPAKDSVRGIETMSVGGKTYRILKTTERDPYDPPERTSRGNKPFSQGGTRKKR
jgi:hypothetical protein